MVGLVLDCRRLLIDGLRFRRADVFERDGLEQIVTHDSQLRQHAIDARIAIARAFVEVDGLYRVRENDCRGLPRQEESLVQRGRARVSFDYEAAGFEPVDDRAHLGFGDTQFASERPRRDVVATMVGAIRKSNKNVHGGRVYKIRRQRTEHRRNVTALHRGRQFGAEQNQRPRDVRPDQENWQRRECAVDCVVVGDAHLEAHVAPLRELKKHHGHERTDQRGTVPDLRVWKKDIQEKESGPHEQVRQQLRDKRKVRNPHRENRGETERRHDQKRHREQHAQVVGEFTEVAAALRHVEDRVERLLDRTHRRDHRDEQERAAGRTQCRRVDVLDVGHQLRRR